MCAQVVCQRRGRTTPRRRSGRNTTLTLQARGHLGASYEHFLRDVEAAGNATNRLVKDFIGTQLGLTYTGALRKRVLRAHKFSQQSSHRKQVDMLDPRRRALQSDANRECKMPCIGYELMEFFLEEGLRKGSRINATILLTRAKEICEVLRARGFQYACCLSLLFGSDGVGSGGREAFVCKSLTRLS